MIIDIIFVLCSTFILLHAAATKPPIINSLPPCLHAPPEPLDPSLSVSRLQGSIPPAASLGPRAVLGYVSDKDWALVEFIAMTHASWRHLTGPAAAHRRIRQGQGRSVSKLDIWAFAHPRWANEMSAICTVVDLDSDLDSVIVQGVSQCFAILYPMPPQEIWHG